MGRRLDNLLNWTGRRLVTDRLPDDEGASTPDEEIDLQAWGATADRGLGQRIKDAKRAVGAGALLVLVGLGLAYAYATRYLVDVLSSPTTWWTLALVGTAIGMYVAGTRKMRSRLTDTNWLVLILPDGTKSYVGEFETAGDGTQVFLPYRGFGPFGHKSRPLYLRELGERVARAQANQGRDPEDPVRIRVDDARVEVKDTAYGTVVGVMTDGLAVDQFGRYSDVYCEPPSQVSEENYRQLRDQLDQYVEHEVPRLRKRMTALRQENERLRDELGWASDEDPVDEFLEKIQKLPGFNRRDGRRRERETVPATVGETNGTATLMDLEEKEQRLEEYNDGAYGEDDDR